MPTPTKIQPGIREFIDTCLIFEEHEEVKVQFLFNRWVHFAQTHESCKHQWAAGVPHTSNTLVRQLRLALPDLTTTRQACTFKRGDRSREEYSPVRILTILKNYKFNLKASWNGMRGPWYWNPWLIGPLGAGGELKEPDPSHMALLAKRAIVKHRRRNLGVIIKEAGLPTNHPVVKELYRKVKNVLHEPSGNIKTDAVITQEMIETAESMIRHPVLHESFEVTAYKIMAYAFEEFCSQLPGAPRGQPTLYPELNAKKPTPFKAHTLTGDELDEVLAEEQRIYDMEHPKRGRPPGSGKTAIPPPIVDPFDDL